MAANNLPIFTGAPRISSVRITGSTAASDGTGTIGTGMFLAFTPGIDGSYLQRVRFSLSESTMSTASAATTLRVGIATVNTGTLTTSNYFLYQEVNAPAQTPTTTTSSYPIDVPLNFALPPNYYLIVSCSVAPATNTAWVATVIGGDY
jgi:hypothetical protein